MAFVFIKQIICKIVSTIGNLSFGKLSAEKERLPPLVLKDGKIDISELGLKPGIYSIRVTACAEGLEESYLSDAELLIITK